MKTTIKTAAYPAITATLEEALPRKKEDGVRRRSEYMTLRELKQMITPTTGLPLPTMKQLRSGADPLEVYISEMTPGYSISVYPSGFALAINGKHYAVIRVDACGDYTYKHTDSTLSDPEFMKPMRISEAEFLDRAWPIRVMLTADDQLQKNEDELEGNWIKKHPQIVERVWKDQESMAQSSEDTVIAKMEREEMLRLLTEKQRRVFILYYDCGYTQREIAEMLEVSKTAIFKSLQASLKKLAKNAK